MSNELQFINTKQSVPEDTTNPFQLTVPSQTDIWRTPPAKDDFSGPVLYRSISPSTFRGARVTVSADWTRLYDQGGLIIVLPPQTSPTNRQDGSGGGGGTKQRWVKAGVEMLDGKTYMSVVAADRWADWSLRPHGTRSLTLEFERKIKDGKPQSALWIYIVEGVERTPVREVTWVFEDDLDGDDDQGSKDAQIWIGVYAARPHADPGDMVVSFSDWKINTA